jgi:hypothetical protein
MKKEDTRNCTYVTESLKIKSKRNICRKQYQKHLKRKKEMTPTLGFRFGRFISKKKPFASCSQVEK